MSDLLPCPFCGSEAYTETYVVEAVAGCRGCRIKAARGHSPYEDDGLEKAIAAWNTRTAQAQIDAAVKAERERCAKVADNDADLMLIDGVFWCKDLILKTAVMSEKQAKVGRRIANAIRKGGQP